MSKGDVVLSVVTVLFFIYLFSVFNSCQSSENKIASTDSLQTDSSDFVGDVVCGSCHVQEYADWKKSDHYHSMLSADDSSVTGDFNNAMFSADGITSKFFKKNGQFIISTEGSDGLNHDFVVKYTFGHFPLQQYLIEFPGGRMQVARQSWDTKKQKWFHQYPERKIAPNDWLHWTNRGQNWNASCASCHSTNLQENYFAAEDSFHTTWSVVNVSCESCHGAGKKHIDYISSADYKSGETANGSFILPDTNQLVQINSCAPCHSRRFTIDGKSPVTDELLNHFIPESPHKPAYHTDGQILEEDYEYASFLQSKMFQHNIKCSSCHNPHSGKLILSGNDLCLKCHSQSYTTPQHTMHKINSEGALCVSCHAPGKYYMGNDFRRDHSFRVPRPDLTVKFATPNACNSCHSDKSAKWASEQIIKHFNEKRSYHFSEDLIPASMGLFSSIKNIEKLSMPDTSVPAIIRATAMYYATFVPHPSSVNILLKGLKDENSQVRYEALCSLKNFPVEQWKTEAEKLLNDKVKAVRIAAADLFLPYSDSLSVAGYNFFAVAKKELFDFLVRNSSEPNGRLMLADAQLRAKNYIDAEKNYLIALKMDSLLIQARLNLATFYSLRGDNKKALQQLKISEAISPNDEQVNYFLALLYAEMADLAFSEKYFKKLAATSKQSKVFYNYGLVLEQMKQDKTAEAIYLQGLKFDKDNIDMNYVLALFYYNHDRKTEALKYFGNLNRLLPDNLDFKRMYDQTKTEVK